ETKPNLLPVPVLLLGEKNLRILPGPCVGKTAPGGWEEKRLGPLFWLRLGSGSSRYPAARSYVSHCKHLIVGRGSLNPALIPSLIAGISGSQPVNSQLKMSQMCSRTAVLSLRPEMPLHHFSLVTRAIISVSLISVSLTGFSCRQILYSEGCTENRRAGSARCLSRIVKAALYLKSTTATVPRQNKLTCAMAAM
uniref:Uncharacterized protein n=1 Tax=Junco hyemalis TaxID=40217 RepID=A0A8C5IER0_JUNHY